MFAESKIWIKLKHLVFGPFNPIIGWFKSDPNIGWFKSDPNIGSIQESKFWIACSNYRLNHPMCGLLEHKTEVAFP